MYAPRTRMNITMAALPESRRRRSQISDSLMMRNAGVVCLICSVAAALPAGAKEQNAVPDFSGIWARTTFGYDLPESGGGPLKNLARRANGTSDAFKLVGDYNNPVLQPWAAEIVKQHGVVSLAGKSYP